ncbi:hypothetical protein GGS20DRAFT_527754, partial [Poronia punctata]
MVSTVAMHRLLTCTFLLPPGIASSYSIVYSNSAPLTPEERPQGSADRIPFTVYRINNALYYRLSSIRPFIYNL